MMTRRIAVDVSRGSHVHQTPHVGRPQIDPSAIVSAVSTAATSAADAARRSHFSWRFQRYITLPTSTTTKARKAFHAAGTCTYMIFCRWPMSRSGGDVNTPNACAAATAARTRNGQISDEEAVDG